MEILIIYNIKGEQIRHLEHGFKEPGVYRRVWDGRSDAGTQVSSGTYFYKLTADSFTKIKRLVFLK